MRLFSFGDACVNDLCAPARCERSFAIYRQLTHSLCTLFIVALPSHQRTSISIRFGSRIKGKINPNQPINTPQTFSHILRICYFFPNKGFFQGTFGQFAGCKKLHLPRSGVYVNKTRYLGLDIGTICSQDIDIFKEALGQYACRQKKDFHQVVRTFSSCADGNKRRYLGREVGTICNPGWLLHTFGVR